LDLPRDTGRERHLAELGGQRAAAAEQGGQKDRQAQEQEFHGRMFAVFCRSPPEKAIQKFGVFHREWRSGFVHCEKDFRLIG
jgi:hypothetical protein